MAHYTVGLVTPTSTDWIGAYAAGVGPILARHGGRYVFRTGAHEVLEGDASPAVIVLIEWPSAEAERAFFADPDYAPHRAARRDGSESTLYSVPPQDDLA
jgi:uncharacterized protein (DUF1330 family)